MAQIALFYNCVFCTGTYRYLKRKNHLDILFQINENHVRIIQFSLKILHPMLQLQTPLSVLQYTVGGSLNRAKFLNTYRYVLFLYKFTSAL